MTNQPTSDQPYSPDHKYPVLPAHASPHQPPLPSHATPSIHHLGQPCYGTSPLPPELACCSQLDAAAHQFRDIAADLSSTGSVDRLQFSELYWSREICTCFAWWHGIAIWVGGILWFGGGTGVARTPWTPASSTLCGLATGTRLSPGTRRALVLAPGIITIIITGSHHLRHHYHHQASHQASHRGRHIRHPLFQCHSSLCASKRTSLTRTSSQRPASERSHAIDTLAQLFQGKKRHKYSITHTHA